MLFQKISLALAILLPTFNGFAIDKPTREMSISRNTLAVPTIDGKLDDAIWQQGTWEGSFSQYIPNEKAKPSQETEFKIFHDDSFIYAAFRCLDTEPSKISSILSRRDDASGDRIGLEFDSYNDHITSFCFYVNASGVKLDYTSSDNNGQDDSWNPIWWVKTSKDEKGWYAEMRIPLSELRFKPAENSKWGLEVIRWIFRSQERDVWQPMSREQQGWNANLGVLRWNEKIDSKLPFNITPYVVVQADKFLKDPDNPFRKTGHTYKANVGFDAKIGISNNWTTDITVNPDFGQVDADPSQVNLTAYEIYQQERRPFFVEGRNIFTFGLGVGDGDLGSESLFYTRRIGRRPHLDPDLKDDEYIKRPEFTTILGAAKISGRDPNGLSVGVMEAVTSQEFARVGNKLGEHEVEVEPLTNYAVARVSKEMNNANTQFGAIVTSTIRNINASQLDYLHKSATTGGVNLLQYFDDKKWSLNFSTYFSRVEGSKEAILQTQEAAGHYFQRPDAPHLGIDSSRTSLTGNGGKLILSKESGKLRMLLCGIWKSPKLEVNDLGFVRSVDRFDQIYWVGYRFTKPKGIMRMANLNFNQWAEWTYGGEYQGMGGNINGSITFKNLWSLGLGSNINVDQKSTDLLRGGPSVKMGDNINGWLGFRSDDSKEFFAEANFSAGANTSNSSDVFTDYGITFTYRPTSFLNVSVMPGYFRETNKLQYVDQYSGNKENRYLLAKIEQRILRLSLRVNFNITPNLTLQYWGQPFVATGDYSEFKRADKVMSNRYNERFHIFTPSQISYDSVNETYKINEAGYGQYEFSNPNFTSTEFLSNMVLRWEYTPGNTLFVVWSQNRDYSTSLGRSQLGKDIGDLFSTYPYDVFLVKASFRIGR
jgi:Domain of unknown function (DUF1083).